MGVEKSKRSAVTVAVLVLAACHLALAVSKVPPPLDGQAARVEPVGYLASTASSVLAAYVASAACGGRGGQRRLPLGALLAEARRTWARPAATALYIELLTTAMASLLLTLRAFLAAAGATAAGLLAVVGSVALVGWLGPVLFAHSDIACRMSLVVAAAEEGCGGAAAVRRAEALVAGRRAQGVALGLVASAIEQAPAWVCGDAAPTLVVAAAVLAAKTVACCACAAFYYHCRWKRREVSTSSKLVAECCQVGWDRDLDVSEETDVEEFGVAFGCFRLTWCNQHIYAAF